MNRIVRVGVQNKLNEERKKAIQKILLELNQMSALVIVEGLNDRKAIRSLGYTGELFEISGKGRGLSKFASEAQKFNVIVPLLDFDRGGRKLEYALKIRSNIGGITLNYNIRKKIKSIIPNLIHIEDLKNLVA